MTVSARSLPPVALLLLVVPAGCASTSSRRAPSARAVEVTWQADRVASCRELGCVRVKDGLGAPAPDGRLDDWDDEIARNMTASLGGNVVLRVVPPQNLLRVPAGPELPGTETTMTYTPRPDDSAVIGVAYRCETPRI